MKIGIYVAHDDDSILGVGGQIVQYLKQKNEVHVVIFTGGETSHQVVLGIEESPSPLELKVKRKEEILEAMKILGLLRKEIHFLDIPTRQVKEHFNDAKRKASKIIEEECPDVVYFHYPDAHRDHRAVSQIMLEILKSLDFKPKIYQFLIWTKGLAEGRTEVCDKDVPEIPDYASIINIEKEEVALKRKAIYEMKSQVLNWPYRDWQIQEKPILDKAFIEYFLRGEEILLKSTY